MIKNKTIKYISLLLCSVIIFSFAGCGKKQQVEAVSTNNADYVLTSDSGTIALFDAVGRQLDEVTLGNSDSKYIYTEDTATMYLQNLHKGTPIPTIIYAVDTANGKATIVSIAEDKIHLSKEYVIQLNNFDDIRAYQGNLFIKTEDKIADANKYTYTKSQQITSSGEAIHQKTVPINKQGTKAYFVMKNLVDDYMAMTGYKDMMTGFEKNMIFNPDKDVTVFEIPTKIEEWEVTNKGIFFTNQSQMGFYNIAKNEIAVYNNTEYTVDSIYIDGIDKTFFSASTLADNGEKTTLNVIDADDLRVKNSIELAKDQPMAACVSKDRYVAILFKNTDTENIYSKIKVLSYEDYSELYTMTLNYVPTIIKGKGTNIYAFNPYEDHFLMGSVGNKALASFSKINETTGEKYTNIFIVGRTAETDYYYDSNGKLTNKEGKFIDYDGNIVNENFNRLNELGQRIDADGRAINDDGQFVDNQNNIIDLKGNVLEYIKHDDGYFYNSKGEKVDFDGTVLIRNDEGDWVRPEEINSEESLIITGHYDEDGNFIIDKDILEKYPDAYEIWERRGH